MSMSRINFNPRVGETVRFREWEDMLEEFGTDSFGDIDCQFMFTKEMRPLCGTEFVIECIKDDDLILGHDTSFSVSSDMLEYVSIEVFDTKEIDEFFNTIIVKES